MQKKQMTKQTSKKTLKEEESLEGGSNTSILDLIISIIDSIIFGQSSSKSKKKDIYYKIETDPKIQVGNEYLTKLQITIKVTYDEGNNTYTYNSTLDSIGKIKFIQDGRFKNKLFELYQRYNPIKDSSLIDYHEGPSKVKAKLNKKNEVIITAEFKIKMRQ